MKISELIERVGRTVFEAPFGAMAQIVGDSPEVAEIRIAVLDAVSKKIQRAGGKALFPYNLVRIVICAGADAAVFERDFFRKFFEEEVRKGLSKEVCRFPDDLRVDIRVEGREAGQEGGWLRIEALSEEVEPQPEETARVRRAARLVVVAGNANKPEVLLQKTRTNIGRLVDVYKAEGLSRRNDLAFADDNAINRTVSREHAHILHDKRTGEYRLFNDRWYKRGHKAENNCGLWIVRDGLGQEVHRDTRGTRLLPGDEIHLGKAVVKFQIK
ncbi:MAG TPA: FHA domain-containing protein [Bryobacteraceae bacterium]|nr:FHA domain-containing protein [Bryobacteraceae bacterium]